MSLMASLLFLGIPILFALLLILIGLAILAFEIMMFIDVISNPKISDDRRLAWIIGMLLIHPIVAIVYYFTDRRGRY